MTLSPNADRWSSCLVFSGNHIIVALQFILQSGLGIFHVLFHHDHLPIAIFRITSSTRSVYSPCAISLLRTCSARGEAAAIPSHPNTGIFSYPSCHSTFFISIVECRPREIECADEKVREYVCRLQFCVVIPNGL